MSQPAALPWYYRLLTALLLGLAHLPLTVLHGFARLIYWLLAYVVHYREKVVLDNLRHAFPAKTEAEIRRITRQFYWHFAQVMVEILKLASISAEELKRRMRFSNPEVLGAPLAAGRQVLVLGSHMGNWEWILGGAALLFPGQITGVYKLLNNKFFEQFTLRLRTRLGAGAVPMLGTFRHLVRYRGQGQELSLLIDQAAGPDDRPYWTDFLNREAGFYTSADRLAVQFDCDVLYVGVRRVRRGYYEARFVQLPQGEEISAGAKSLDALERFPATEAFVRQLEADIRAYPEQYLWTHRRWKHTRPAHQ
ncbi:lysophospholipid acyltransferase family protein [Hymenobacter cheonanensis]|uniref:lysophospholipid acyltransferase family protein n=1 Tax=Hymenobacter sp. CA2-7 TaxID=3063993 RepID=UPI002713D7BD|nr:lysophospholipid acyltransferase family protein [Hymenobacter sp. CA2-7]MDO7886529.1 lysophospholipid acyltransferase family protein [Hymenobacter sp. CA2-7]